MTNKNKKDTVQSPTSNDATLDVQLCADFRASVSFATDGDTTENMDDSSTIVLSLAIFIGDLPYMTDSSWLQ